MTLLLIICPVNIIYYALGYMLATQKPQKSHGLGTRLEITRPSECGGRTLVLFQPDMPDCVPFFGKPYPHWGVKGVEWREGGCSGQGNGERREGELEWKKKDYYKMKIKKSYLHF